MKKLLLVLVLMVVLPAFSQELQGGVTYDVNSARAYVQDGQQSDIGQQSNLYYSSNGNDADIIYIYDTNGVPNAFVAQYKDDNRKAYFYGMNNKLQYVDKYDKPPEVYPHRAYRYTTKGKLATTALMTSKNNGFVFTPKGKLTVRLVDGVGYLGNSNIIVGSQSKY